MDEPPPLREPMPRTIGRYQVQECIGHGAMGEVYKAFDPLSSRTVAVKTVRLDLPQESPQYKSFIERSYREARIAGALSHPNIATVLDVGEEGGRLYVAMELLEGETISSVLSRGLRFKPEKAIGLVSQVASAIDYAHGKGVIHCDIKPSNLMLAPDGVVKVMDFGRAAALADVTRSGMLLGTPSYLSPEQAMGEKPDGRSDIFSLGVCAFEMLSGELPFPGNNITGVLYKLIHADPIEPENLEMSGLVPEKWHEVFGRVLAKKPKDRYQTATAFVQDLEYCFGAWFGDVGVEEAVDSAVGEVDDVPRIAPEPPLAVHENVQFTVYRPRLVEPMRWYPLLAFAHVEDLPPGSGEDEPGPADQVREQAERALGSLAGAYAQARQDSSIAIPHEAEITFVPEIPGFDVNPARRTFLWLEPVHREDFRVRAGATVEGQLARGRVSVFWGRILLADVALSIRVGSEASAAAAAPASSAARPFRKIFASYSHKDATVVEEFERYGRALGDVYLRDITHLRAGEHWDQRLLDLIGEADLFQLFWSWNALQSPFVEKEWRYALSLQRPNFLRPTYWEEPLPAAPERDLPPDELRRLHFQLLPARPRKRTSPPARPASAPPMFAGRSMPPMLEDEPATVSTPLSARRPLPPPPRAPAAPTMEPASRPATMSLPRPAVNVLRDPPPRKKARSAAAGRLWPTVAGALIAGVLGVTAFSTFTVMTRKTSSRMPSPVPVLTSQPSTTGRLELRVIPPAEITVDGKAMGRTPLGPLVLEPGEHAVVVTHAGYATVRRVVTVRRGVTTTIDVDLRRESRRR